MNAGQRGSGLDNCVCAQYKEKVPSVCSLKLNCFKNCDISTLLLRNVKSSFSAAKLFLIQSWNSADNKYVHYVCVSCMHVYVSVYVFV